MNSRIRELADQAGISYLSSVHPDMWEKFAELIIRECAKFADRGTRGGIGDLMKKHFGVGE